MIKKMSENKVLVSCFLLYIITFFLPVNFTNDIVFLEGFDSLDAKNFTPMAIILASITNIPLTIYQYFMVTKSFDLSNNKEVFFSLKLLTILNVIANIMIFFIFPLINKIIIRIMLLQGKGEVKNMKEFYNILSQVYLDILSTLIVPALDLAIAFIILIFLKNLKLKALRPFYVVGLTVFCIELFMIGISYIDIFDLQFPLYKNEILLSYSGFALQFWIIGLTLVNFLKSKTLPHRETPL